MEKETLKHGDIDMRHGNMEKWRHGGDLETWTWTWRHGKRKMENGSPGDFP